MDFSPHTLRQDTSVYKAVKISAIEATQGPQGSQGVQGPQGPQGVQGPQGPQGTSALLGAASFYGDPQIITSAAPHAVLQEINNSGIVKLSDDGTQIIFLETGMYYLTGVWSGIEAAACSPLLNGGELPHLLYPTAWGNAEGFARIGPINILVSVAANDQFTLTTSGSLVSIQTAGQDVVADSNVKPIIVIVLRRL